jgi:hypothetical protein
LRKMDRFEMCSADNGISAFLSIDKGFQINPEFRVTGNQVFITKGEVDS